MNVIKCLGLKCNDDFIHFSELSIDQKKIVMAKRDSKAYRLNGKIYFPVFEESEKPNIYECVIKTGTW